VLVILHLKSTNELEFISRLRRIFRKEKNKQKPNKIIDVCLLFRSFFLFSMMLEKGAVNDRDRHERLPVIPLQPLECTSSIASDYTLQCQSANRVSLRSTTGNYHACDLSTLINHDQSLPCIHQDSLAKHLTIDNIQQGRTQQ
jgi:hypothetical protein